MPLRNRTFLLGQIRLSVAVVGFAVFSSLAITYLSGADDMPGDGRMIAYWMALLIPLLVASVTMIIVGRLSYRHHQLLRTVEYLAHRDDLTGLLNRRAFREAADARLAARAPQFVTLLLIDVDHFKRVNDGYGHDAGDTALRHVAAVLERMAPEGASVARWGGEEFAMLCDWDDRLRLADGVCAAVANSPCDYDGQMIAMTVSIGVATGTGATIAPLLRRADAALYDAKGDGRNRWTMAA